MFSFGLRFVSILGETKAADPNSVLKPIVQGSAIKPWLHWSYPQADLCKGFNPDGFNQVFDIIALLGNVSQGDGAAEPPTQMEPCPRGGCVVGGKIVFRVIVVSFCV